MYTPKEILDRIKDIEKGDEDMETKEMMIKEELKQYHGEDRVVAFKDYKAPNGMGRHHIPTAIPELDEMIGGFGKGDIILISGDTGDGKSTFSRFLIRKFSEQQKNCLVFSYEESNEEFLSKFMGDMPDGYLPMVLTDKSPTWIEARVLEAQEKFGVEVVFIDNLKGLINHESRRNEVSEVDFIIQRLKEIARKYNVVIVLLAHIKKLDSGLIDKNSLTGSKTIVDTASVGIALRRGRDKQTKKEEEENGIKFNNYTSFYLIKNRYQGKYEHFTMLYKPETGLYLPPTKGIISQEDIKRDMQ